MKRIIRKIICVAAVVLAAVSCQKSIEPSNPVEEGSEIIDIRKTINIRVNGLMGEYTQVDATKAELVNTVRVSWKGGETVYVFDGVKCLGSLAAALEGDEDRYAVLSTDASHTVIEPAAGTTTLTLVYSPLLTEAPAVNDDAISISLASQSGEKAPFVAYATLDYTSTTITNAVVPFKFATSVIRVNCTGLNANTFIDQVTLDNVNTECVLAISGDKDPSVAGDVNGVITRIGSRTCSADKVNAEGEAVFQIAVPKLETASGARVLTVAQVSDKSDNFEDKNFSKKAIDPATSVNTVCQLVKALPSGALPGVFTVSDNGGETTKQIYFSQGNLYYDGSKFNFEANQYSFKDSWDATHVSHFYWSKDPNEAIKEEYNREQEVSDVDVFFTNWTETTYEPSFTVNVNGKEQTGWRTLSINEWQYLFNTRTMKNGKDRYTNITYDGKMGLVLYPDDYDNDPIYDSVKTMPEGVVFLPAEKNDIGYYWSSAADDEDFAYCVKFDRFDVRLDVTDYRFFGYSVRLITECQ